MTATKIILPTWVQIVLNDVEKTTKRMHFVLELVKFIEENDIDVCEIYPGVRRLYFDRRGAYLYQYNGSHPWRYNERGLAQAKFELRRLKAQAEADREYLPVDATEVQEAIEAFVALGWGHGMSSGERMLDCNDHAFRFFRRGRWYSLKPRNIKKMLRRARKAQLIMKYFHSKYSLDNVPEIFRPFCLDMLRHINVVEETGAIRFEIRSMYRTFGSRNVDDVKIGWLYNHYPATPLGVKQLERRLGEAAQAWLQIARFEK